jgi:glycosyltransferase involved in cell wall biosynthesis
VEDNKPLVSIIVRTKDRPKLLKKAVRSIAEQTYRQIEVVLVNDGGCDLNTDELKNILGEIPLNYIRLEKNTGRAHAGNVGIRNAKGGYVGFLDDDDEYYPEHVGTLVSSAVSDGSMIYYSDVMMIEKFDTTDAAKDDDLRTQVFSSEFSSDELLIANHIPFNAVLFDRAVFEETSLLDETFELYEDWDLLIRLSEKHPFRHVKKITAIYHQWNKDLQINQKNQQLCHETQLRIINKHKGKISPQFLMNSLNLLIELRDKSESLNEKIKTIEKKEEIIADLNKEIMELNKILSDKEKEKLIEHRLTIQMQDIMTGKEKIISEKEKIISEKEQEIVALNNSLIIITQTFGWRMLEKLRRMRDILLPKGANIRTLYGLGEKSLKYIEREGFGRFLKKVMFKLKLSKLTDTRNDYSVWIKKNEPDSNALMGQKMLSDSFHLKPKISIITPVYNPDRKCFVEMLESVMSQTYGNWELCLADASTFPYVREIIDSYAERERSKIKVLYLKNNYGISENSNRAISLASGEYMALLDHDDTLAPFALFEAVKAINESPDVDFIYSDRDKVTNDGVRFDPFFKPDWSPDYLLSQNYVCHLNVFSRDIIKKVGGFRGYDGSQDYDLVLRVTEATGRIIHIPKILYHWKVTSGSAAGDSEAKPYAYEAAVRALQDSVNRRGWKATVTQGLTRGLYRVWFHVDRLQKVSIIIPTKDNVEILRRCVDSILQKTTYTNYEIVIVDNKSRENATFNYYATLKDNKKISLLRYDKPFNFSEINNFGVSQTNAEYVLFLNNDTEVITENWLDLMVGFAQRKETGAVGVKLLYPNDTIQHAGLILDERGNVKRSHRGYPRFSLGYAGRIMSVQNVAAVAAACMLMRREVFDEVGGFDPEFVIAHGDIDLCLKLLERGYLIVYEPHAELYHHESYTRGYEDTPEKVERLKKETELLLKKRGYMLKNADPYFNPNLTAENEDYSIRI